MTDYAQEVIEAAGLPRYADERAYEWADDLQWHRRAFRQSRFRWLPEHVLEIVTLHTGGQLEFTKIKDLQRIAAYQATVAHYGHQIRVTMAKPLRTARDVFGGWEPVAELLDLGLIETRGIVWSAMGESPVATATTDYVLDGIPMSNPLIESWELKQALRMYQAAYDVLEDTLCQLVDELAGSVPDAVLVAATEDVSATALTERCNDAKAARTAAGGRIPIPTQTF